MGKKAKAINRNKILKELKGETEPEKRNVTFSLPKSLVKNFSDDCKKHSLTMNRVIQKLIEDYME